jgi:hypothetical protein
MSVRTKLPKSSSEHLLHAGNQGHDEASNNSERTTASNLQMGKLRLIDTKSIKKNQIPSNGYSTHSVATSLCCCFQS